MKLKLPKFIQLPQFDLDFDIEPIKKIVSFLIRHKILIIVVISLIVFVTFAMWYRGFLLSKMKSTPQNSTDEIFYYVAPTKLGPSISIPSPSPYNSNNDETGTSNNSYSNDNASLTIPTPFPTFVPLPTITPEPTVTSTTETSSTTNNSSQNSNCTTATGVPNSWYSDVYPNPPVSTNTGSVTLIVNIRDCNENLAPVNDNLTITLSSNDSTAKINGSSSPVNIQTQNGQVSFTVSSQNTTTDTFVIQDTTSSFTVTNINNQNPSVVFTNNSSGNSNCTTATGVPNSWYSDVYPTSPVSSATGSTVTFTVDIRDCNQTEVSSDNLSISQSSNDSSLTINGSAPPVSVQTQNGQASFTVTSQNATTDSFVVQDTTSSFKVTDTNNNNPSVVFSGSSSPTPTVTPTITPTPTPTTTSSPTSSQSASPTP